VAVAIPLLLSYGHAGDLADTTSGKILAVALLAMGFGSLAAARDPWPHRLVIQVLIAFTVMSTLAIVYRLVVEQHQDDKAWVLLPFAVAAPVLLAIYYPRRPSG
jgi:hypothetical protein